MKGKSCKILRSIELLVTVFYLLLERESKFEHASLDVDVDYVDNAEESDQCPGVSLGLQYETFTGIRVHCFFHSLLLVAMPIVVVIVVGTGGVFLVI